MAKLWGTPPNQVSFSGLVDQVVLETGRTAALRSIIQAANMTVRECQAFALLAQDVVEGEITVDVVPFTWTRPPYFRSFAAIEYSYSGRQPKLRRPGSQQRGVSRSSSYGSGYSFSDTQDPWWYYAANDYYAFNGVCVGELIKTAAYFWAKPLLYMSDVGVNLASTLGGTAYQTRTAYFDLNQDAWMYLQADGVTYGLISPDLDGGVQAQKNAMNWIVQGFFDMIKEGTKAKIYNTYNDSRATASYGTYKTNQTLFRSQVEAESSAR